MKKLSLMFIFTILICNIANAAIIQGTIYDLSLNKITNAIVEINTKPIQKTVSVNGNYLFNVPLGEYNITVKTQKNVIIAQEEIEIINEGTFSIDLFAFPDLNEDNTLEELDLDINESDLETNNNYVIPFSIVLILIILITLVLLFLKFRKKPKEEISNIESKDLSEKVLEIIRKEGRINQKDLRKKFPLSEAKISLVISELEAKGKIEKIKKGRGNILIIKNQ